MFSFRISARGKESEEGNEEGERESCWLFRSSHTLNVTLCVKNRDEKATEIRKRGEERRKEKEGEK